MEITNRYFIGTLPNSDMSKIYDVIIGNSETQRANKTNNKVVIKLRMGDVINHSVLRSFQEFTHNQILTELQNPEWN